MIDPARSLPDLSIYWYLSSWPAHHREAAPDPSTTRKPGHCTDNRDDSEKDEKGGETKKKQEEKGSRSDESRSIDVRVVYSF
jgi:hypothetical protein